MVGVWSCGSVEGRVVVRCLAVWWMGVVDCLVFLACGMTILSEGGGLLRASYAGCD